MNYHIQTIIEKIEQKNPAHAKKIKNNLNGLELELFPASEVFFNKYEAYLKTNNHTIDDYAVDCYLKMYADMLEERWKFIKTGNYSSVSFADVEKRIYSNPEVMEYHMNGLVLGQFLWFEQYERFKFFSENILSYTDNPKRYLEIGGGHGLYMMEALSQLPPTCSMDLLDVSSSSIVLAKGIINDDRVNYRLQNLLEINDEDEIDFFTMGEVLEHLENPASVLMKLSKLIRNGGKGFISTPVNSPMIDHIYLFRSVLQIRELFERSGLTILKEKIVISEHITAEQAEKLRVPIMYAAFVETKR